MIDGIHDYFKTSSDTLLACSELDQDIQTAARVMIRCLETGGTIMWCGNGGSASDAEHLSAELVGRFARDRRPLRSLALTCNSSITLALSNDYGFDQVFARQVAGVGRSGDVLVAISTSGESSNVIAAARMARTMGIVSIALTGQNPSTLAGTSDYTLRAPSRTTSHIQECHIAIGQLLCGLVEAHLFAS
jgi:D-sedoheptulose 7-phosphate isomerase